MYLLHNIKEEIARSRSTPNTDPVQFDDDPDIQVELHGNDDGKWSVKVVCLSKPELSTSLQTFGDEASATHFARVATDEIRRTTMNEVRWLIRNLILEVCK